MTNHTCLRCSHTWFPRIQGRPVSCPQCKSRLWDVPRVEKRTETPEETNKKGIEEYLSHTNVSCDDPMCPFHRFNPNPAGGRP